MPCSELTAGDFDSRVNKVYKVMDVMSEYTGRLDNDSLLWGAAVKHDIQLFKVAIMGALDGLDVNLDYLRTTMLD